MMKNIIRKSYIAPIAELVLVDGNADIMDVDVEIGSAEGEIESGAKYQNQGAKYSFGNEIWDSPEE